MKIPYSKDELNAAQIACVRDNKLVSCYIRPLAFYGSEVMGVAAKSNPVRVAVAVWPWGAYLGAEALEKGEKYLVVKNLSSYTTIAYLGVAFDKELAKLERPEPEGGMGDTYNVNTVIYQNLPEEQKQKIDEERKRIDGEYDGILQKLAAKGRFNPSGN
jgi:hypothetical protein